MYEAIGLSCIIWNLHIIYRKSGFDSIMLSNPAAETHEAQIIAAISGKRISSVIAAHTPKELTWYNGDPRAYNSILEGKVITKASIFRGIFQIKADKAILLFSEGVVLTFHPQPDERPDTHQLLIEFEDCSMLSASVKSYGGFWCYMEGEMANPYFGVNAPNI